VPVARGGDGGVGNRAFRSSTRQAPRNTTPGAPGEEAWLTLELRLPVDVGIVGLPNAGKSALLVALTGAAATVAPYPQSTREPAFGPLEDEDANLYLVADLPGLAADGAPRPDAHLEQLERARVVLHAVDAADPVPAAERIATVRDAVAPYMTDGAREIVVATHADHGEPVPEADVAVDSESGDGIQALRDRVVAALRA
jgi:GTP-binding protein